LWREENGWEECGETGNESRVTEKSGEETGKGRRGDRKAT
jgi:hypothetical protein